MKDIKISDGIFLIRDTPAAFIRKLNALVIGDLHIGMENKLSRSGIHFEGQDEVLGSKLLEICEYTNADRIIFLGDVKDSIGYPERAEYLSLAIFFRKLDGKKIYIAKGNHDSHLKSILQRLKIKAVIQTEIKLGKYAFIHGNTLPSEGIMKCDYIFAGHGHFAATIGGMGKGKVCVLCNLGKNAKSVYKKYNKKARLILMPAFSNLITGSDLEDGMNILPLLRRGVFKNNKIYKF